MPKILTECNKWGDNWFMKLSPQAKLIWIYVCENCDKAGVYEKNEALLKMQIGFSDKVNLDVFFSELDERVIWWQDKSRIWIKNYIKHQYGKLSEKSHPHRKVIEKCSEYLDNDSTPEKVKIFFKSTLPTTLLTTPMNRIEEEEEVIGGVGDFESENLIAPSMQRKFVEFFPKYPKDKDRDYPACLQIAYKLADMLSVNRSTVISANKDIILKRWGELVEFISVDKWFSTRSIHDINNEWQRIIQAYNSKEEKNIYTIPQSNDINQRLAAAKKAG